MSLLVKYIIFFKIKMVGAGIFSVCLHRVSGNFCGLFINTGGGGGLENHGVRSNLFDFFTLQTGRVQKVLKTVKRGDQKSLNTCAVHHGPLMTIIFGLYVESTISATITRQNWENIHSNTNKMVGRLAIIDLILQQSNSGLTSKVYF